MSITTCKDCLVNTDEVDEYYMVHDSVWKLAFPKGRGMLCIGCLEQRLGRRLNPDDFPDYPVNRIGGSERLLSRL